MGIWGTGIYSNDIACDVRDTYFDLLKQQYSDEDAYNRIVEIFNDCIGTDEEAFYIYALADTQWKYGRLELEVKEKALNFIAQKGGIEHFEDYRSLSKQWEKSLDKLNVRLNSPMPKRKTVKNEPYFESNPWNVGDVYAYKLHSRQAEELGLNGKYLVIHKIGDEEIMGWGILSRVVVYDGIFDKLPTIQDIQHLRVLPFYNPNHYIASFENVQILRNISIMLCRYKKSHYDEKDYTFIGNIVVNGEYSYGKEYAEIYYWPIEVEHWLKFKSLWETFNYRFENGVYIVEQK